MSLFRSILRRSVLCLPWMLSGVCGAQQSNTQFDVPQITRIRSQAVPSIATTVTLALCVGGSAPNCPVNGTPSGLQVVPALTMYYGQVFNGTEGVTDNDGTPFTGGGTLTFYEDGIALCQLLAAVPASCPPSVGSGTTAGMHGFTSVYSGDALHTGSTSNTVTIDVLEDTTAAIVVGGPDPSPFGQPVTFTATLTGSYAPPDGPVVFLDGSTVLGTATLVPSTTSGVSSTATFTTSALPVGADPITVTYASTQNFAAAASGVFIETITPLIPGSFTLTVAPNLVDLGVGYGAVLAVTVTALNGFADAVNLSCGNLPAEAKCIFGNPAIAPGGGTTSMFLITTAPHTCGTTQPYFLGGNGGGPGMVPFALPAIAGLVVVLLPGRHRWLRGLLVMVAVAGTIGMTGCSTCTDLGTRPATYTIQVTGTAAGTPEVESQTVTMTVTI